MSRLKLEDLRPKVREIFSTDWNRRNGRIVPDTSGLTLTNSGVDIEACVLYCDLDESTNVVDSVPDSVAAEIYKTYLHCAAKIIRDHDGEIVSYDGDRIMSIFVGNEKCMQAVWCAMKLTYAVRELIRSEIVRKYNGYQDKISHTCGIDTGSLLVAKTGIRSYNDLVWVGSAANYAAKMTSGGKDEVRITSEVMSQLPDWLIYSDLDIYMWRGQFLGLGRIVFSTDYGFVF
ncbi:MAG: adenylate/guanylate cyclase domain-containing protein [Rhodothermales bacterium]|nr:adenylate/guanylate cyclase domain-containing protein [Rhodothermales bacterium]